MSSSNGAAMQDSETDKLWKACEEQRREIELLHRQLAEERTKVESLVAPGSMMQLQQVPATATQVMLNSTSMMPLALTATPVTSGASLDHLSQPLALPTRVMPLPTHLSHTIANPAPVGNIASSGEPSTTAVTSQDLNQNEKLDNILIGAGSDDEGGDLEDDDDHDGKPVQTSPAGQPSAKRLKIEPQNA